MFGTLCRHFKKNMIETSSDLTQLSLLLRFKFHNCYANVFALKANETLCRNDKIMSTKRGGSPKKLDKRL